MYEIHKNIPIPPVDRTPKQRRPRTYPLEDMDVGDVFYLPGRKCKFVSANVSRAVRKRRIAGKFVARTCYMRVAMPGETPVENGYLLTTADAVGAEESTGVWRAE